jgi:hypothetical protein
MVKGRNEPIAIARVAHVIASVKGITVEEVCEAYAVTGFWCLVLPANIFLIVLGITRSACLDWVRRPLDCYSRTSCYGLDTSTFSFNIVYLSLYTFIFIFRLMPSTSCLFLYRLLYSQNTISYSESSSVGWACLLIHM